MKKIHVGGSTKMLGEEVLSSEKDLDLGSIIESGRDKEPEVGEGIGRKELTFVEEEEGGLFGGVSVLEDAKEEAVLASGRRLFTQSREHDFQQGERPQIRQVNIDWIETSDVEGVKEKLQEGGFADASRASNKGDKAVVDEVVETSQCLGETLVGEDLVHRDVFAEGSLGHLEVLSEHGYSFGFWL
jgi:hypothetical protein